MKDRTILVHNDLYALSTIIEADRDEYVELQRQQEGEASLFSNPASKDIMWKSVIENKNQYAILSASREFCGFVRILDESRTPEISIALLEKHRNKEIAKNAISLLVEKTYDPEYTIHLPKKCHYADMRR